VMETRRVFLLVSDPWEFGEAMAWRPLAAEIVRAFSGSDVVIRFLEPLTYHDATWSWAVVGARHEGSSLDEVDMGREVPVNVSGFPGDYEPPHDWDASWSWSHRQGLAFIGTVAAAPE
jgi:hypothetical protein